MGEFILKSDYLPTGDQPKAIELLTSGVRAGMAMQVLLGVTGSGKTFTLANVIAETKLPALIISHNKTLAAQLYQEFRDYFPLNHVEYFVSYYDYYQPEAYVPQRDQYIEKEADINDEIDKLRLSATTSLMNFNDTIIISSVSCIYNLGSPREYINAMISFKTGQIIPPIEIAALLHNQHYERNDFELKRGRFRIKGDTIDIHLAYEDKIIRLSLMGNTIVKITSHQPTSFAELNSLDQAFIYPAKHYLTNNDSKYKAINAIEHDLQLRLNELRKSGRILEAHRLEQRTKYDLELINEIGYCPGIENYSIYFDERQNGEPPCSLIDFFIYKYGYDFLLIIDESHITVPQIRGMFNGDRSRKQTLIDFGFRLPSALDNRPLTFSEFETRFNKCICSSATPGEWEIDKASTNSNQVDNTSYRGVVEQLIRPTGIIDPSISIRPSENQIDDLIMEIKIRVGRGERVLVTTLTKKMAEDISEYLKEHDIKGMYLHSDVETLKRLDILDDLRSGKYDVLVGINLLREGLDLPEVSLVAILDADKEGFLRSARSLIQVMGRAARHVEGTVIMYADNITGSMQLAIAEVNRRREIQRAHNEANHITPQSIHKKIRDKLIDEVIEMDTKIIESAVSYDDVIQMLPHEKRAKINELTKKMRKSAQQLKFEEAAQYRDQINIFKSSTGL